MWEITFNSSIWKILRGITFHKLSPSQWGEGAAQNINEIVIAL